jgi:hypothetical protein
MATKSHPLVAFDSSYNAHAAMCVSSMLPADNQTNLAHTFLGENFARHVLQGSRCLASLCFCHFHGHIIPVFFRVHSGRAPGLSNGTRRACIYHSLDRHPIVCESASAVVTAVYTYPFFIASFMTPTVPLTAGTISSATPVII